MRAHAKTLFRLIATMLMAGLLGSAHGQDKPAPAAQPAAPVPPAIQMADIPLRADTDHRYAEGVIERVAATDPADALAPRLEAIARSVDETPPVPARPAAHPARHAPGKPGTALGIRRAPVRPLAGGHAAGDFRLCARRGGTGPARRCLASPQERARRRQPAPRPDDAGGLGPRATGPGRAGAVRPPGPPDRWASAPPPSKGGS